MRLTALEQQFAHSFTRFRQGRRKRPAGSNEGLSGPANKERREAIERFCDDQMAKGTPLDGTPRRKW
jgi:hypothetical protein